MNRLEWAVVGEDLRLERVEAPEGGDSLGPMALERNYGQDKLYHVHIALPCPTEGCDGKTEMVIESKRTYPVWWKRLFRDPFWQTVIYFECFTCYRRSDKWSTSHFGERVAEGLWRLRQYPMILDPRTYEYGND